ncbi:hypothetical protein ACHQM5_021933 [Ranunculus cassubicifolius]
MSTATFSQISCFSSINQTRKFQLGKSSLVLLKPCRFKVSVRMNLDSSGTKIPSSGTDTTSTNGANGSQLHVEGAGKSYPFNEEQVPGNLETDETTPAPEAAITPKKTAKIHDFCLGIPFGGIVFVGGVVGSIFSRNLTTLGMGVLLGGGLLALSIFSLQVWRQGKSSLPFILGQSALAVALIWKHVQIYTLTAKFFPAGFYAAMSAAMLCFYSYVLVSGGNPPPKNKKLIIASPP